MKIPNEVRNDIAVKALEDFTSYLQGRLALSSNLELLTEINNIQSDFISNVILVDEEK